MAPPSETPRSNTALVLAVLAVSNGGLAVYQWLELIAVRGGATARCALNDTVNCATVWTSTFASRIHSAVGFPVAGLGVLWSVVGLCLALLLLKRERGGQNADPHRAALKLWGLLGVLSCLTFASASISMKAVCLTCLGTYLLTAAFAVVASLKLAGGPVPPVAQWGKAAIPIAVFLIPGWGALQYPGSLTPRSTEAKAVPGAGGDVAAFFEGLSSGEKQAIADAREAYLTSPQIDGSRYPARFRIGSAQAPVVMVDFTDVLCSHCRALVQSVDAIEKSLPRDALAVEPRYFPLDGECNPAVSHKSGNPVRCLGAKVQLCLEGTPQYLSVRRELFENQEHLTPELIWEIGTKAKSMMELSACVASPATQAKLETDIRYALEYKIDGTPLVLLNGHSTLPVKGFIYGMALAKGDSQSPLFGKLPEPLREPPQ